jgi:hypothetical protein
VHMVVIIVYKDWNMESLSPLVTEDFLSDSEASGALRRLPTQPFYCFRACVHYTHHHYELGVFLGELNNFSVFRGTGKKLAPRHGCVVLDFELNKLRIETLYSRVVLCIQLFLLSLLLSSYASWL